MKTNKRMRLISSMFILLLIVMISIPTMGMADSAPIAKVNLGRTVSFAVLGGQTVTNTGSTVITGNSPEGGGNVGVSPGSAFPGEPDVSMTGWNAHLADTAAADAQIDLAKAYNDAEGRTPTQTFAANDNQLGGKTLTTGVYAFGHAVSANITAASPLTLDAQGDENAVFIFQASSDFVMASDSEIRLINGARFCRVFWQVTSSATLGTGSHFVGHILALTSIWVQNGATVQGQLLARNGEVTLDNNTITNALCATVVDSSSSSSTSNSGISTSSSSNSVSYSSSVGTPQFPNPNTSDMRMNIFIYSLTVISIFGVTAFVIYRKSNNK